MITQVDENPAAEINDCLSYHPQSDSKKGAAGRPVLRRTLGIILLNAAKAHYADFVR
jgi:hypothetical protein